MSWVNTSDAKGDMVTTKEATIIHLRPITSEMAPMLGWHKN